MPLEYAVAMLGWSVSNALAGQTTAGFAARGAPRCRGTLGSGAHYRGR